MTPFLTWEVGETYMIEEPKGEQPRITCLVCGRASFNPNDIAQKYCGYCHQFHPIRSSKLPTMNNKLIKYKKGKDNRWLLSAFRHTAEDIHWSTYLYFGALEAILIADELLRVGRLTPTALVMPLLLFLVWFFIFILNLRNHF